MTFKSGRESKTTTQSAVAAVSIQGTERCLNAGWSERYLGRVTALMEFMAPETLRAVMGTPLPHDLVVSPAADVYSLGALLKALLLGPRQPAGPAEMSPSPPLALLVRHDPFCICSALTR